MMRVWLPEELRARILQEAAIASPRECCGLVEGLRNGEGFRVSAVHPARNLATDMERFDIDPRDHLAASKAARSHGHEIIGCYHSLPAGRAVRSARDVAGADQEDFLWLIAAGGELAAFVYFRGGFADADCGPP